MDDGAMVTATEVLMVAVTMETGHGTCGTQGGIKGDSDVVSGHYG